MISQIERETAPVTYQAPLLEAARFYAARGLKVFPLHTVDDGVCSCGNCAADSNNRGKHPRTTKGFTDATASDEQVVAWWTRMPDSNIGIACRPSGIVVVDIDPRNGGDASLVELEQMHGEMPRTVVAQTGGGGWHMLFRDPGGGLAGKLAPGIDIKANGYIVAPPSVHYSGGSYTWADGCAPWETELATLPAWALEALTRAPRVAATGEELARAREAAERLPPDWKYRRARGWLAQRTPAVEGSGGDHHTFVTACELRGFGLDESEAFSLMLHEWNDACSPPWSPEDLREKVRNAYRYATGMPGEKLNEGPPLRRPVLERRRSAERGAKPARQGPEATEPAPQEGVPSADDSTRPLIRVKGGNLSTTATQGERALIASGLPIFARGGRLVRPIEEEVEAAHGRRAKVARLAGIDAVWLRDALCRVARFEKYDRRHKDDWRQVDPPVDVAHTILGRDGEWSFPTIVRCSRCPG